MRVEIADKELRAIDADHRFVCREFSPALHRSFRKVMGLFRAAADERDLRTLKSLRLERLRGYRAGQHSVRLNDQFKLILRFVEDDSGRKILMIAIVDYH